MLPTSPVPVPEPLALLDATLLFLIQVLLARHPDLLAADNDNDDTLPTPTPACSASNRSVVACAGASSVRSSSVIRRSCPSLRAMDRILSKNGTRWLANYSNK